MSRKSSFKIGTFIKKHDKLIQAGLNFFMLLLTISSITISIIVFKSSNKQFDDNSKKSDSLFNVQLKNQKSFNDSIILNLQKIQNLTDKQNLIIDQQLTISTQLFHDQVNSGAPKFVISNIELNDKNVKLNDSNFPKIFAAYLNIGKRFAYNVKLKQFIILSDFSQVRSNENEPSEPTAPSASIESTFFPKFNKFGIPFYYYAELSYLDRVTGKTTKNFYYKEFSNARNTFDFFDCNKQQIIKVKSCINDYLKTLNQKRMN